MSPRSREIAARWTRYALVALLLSCGDRQARPDETVEPLSWMASKVASDKDGDWLSNADEKVLGTLDGVADTDGDGLLDGWEVHGVNGIDLKKKGADPLKTDIFVEMDWIEDAERTLELHLDGIVQELAAAFEAGDWPAVTKKESKEKQVRKRGIALHLERGSRIAVPRLIDPDAEAYMRKVVVPNFHPLRRPVFRHMVWGWRYLRDDGETNSSGFALPPADKDRLAATGSRASQYFFVAVGPIVQAYGPKVVSLFLDKHDLRPSIASLDGDGVAGSTALSTHLRRDALAGTLMHELGHTLNLLHGGSDDTSYKPNHLSVMNYSFQFEGVVSQFEGVVSPEGAGIRRRFDYQRMRLGPLDESKLAEQAGLGQAAAGYETVVWDRRAFESTYVRRQEQVGGRGSVNWNGSRDAEGKAKIDPGVVSPPRDVNRDGTTARALGATPNEWRRLDLLGDEIGTRKDVSRWPSPATPFITTGLATLVNRARFDPEASVRAYVRHFRMDVAFRRVR